MELHYFNPVALYKKTTSPPPLISCKHFISLVFICKDDDDDTTNDAKWLICYQIIRKTTGTTLHIRHDQAFIPRWYPYVSSCIQMVFLLWYLRNALDFRIAYCLVKKACWCSCVCLGYRCSWRNCMKVVGSRAVLPGNDMIANVLPNSVMYWFSHQYTLKWNPTYSDTANHFLHHLDWIRRGRQWTRSLGTGYTSASCSRVGIVVVTSCLRRWWSVLLLLHLLTLLTILLFNIFNLVFELSNIFGLFGWLASQDG